MKLVSSAQLNFPSLSGLVHSIGPVLARGPSIAGIAWPSLVAARTGSVELLGELFTCHTSGIPTLRCPTGIPVESSATSGHQNLFDCAPFSQNCFKNCMFKGVI